MRVRTVAILEQLPAFDRWERIGAGRWLRCGRLTEHLTEAERLVPWSAVAVCPEGNRHDVKEVTARMAGWQDRDIDRLPEHRHVIYVRSGDFDLSLQAAVDMLRRLDVDDFETSPAGPGGILRFERYGPTMAGAVRTVLLDCEFVGLDVTGVSSG